MRWADPGRFDLDPFHYVVAVGELDDDLALARRRRSEAERQRLAEVEWESELALRARDEKERFDRLAAEFVQRAMQAGVQPAKHRGTSHSKKNWFSGRTKTTYDEAAAWEILRPDEYDTYKGVWRYTHIFVTPGGQVFRDLRESPLQPVPISSQLPGKFNSQLPAKFNWSADWLAEMLAFKLAEMGL